MIETGVIHCGECSEVLATFPDNCIDLAVTSPPYGTLREYNGFTFDFEPIARQLYRVTKPGGVVVWVVADQTKNGSESGTSFRQALYFKSLGFCMETMIYEVAGTGAKGSNYYYWQGFEFMFVFCKDGQPKTSNRIKDVKNKYVGPGGSERLRADGTKKKGKKRVVPEISVRTNVWRFSGDRKGLHPAPFPEALARDHIISWSNPGDIVLDPFVGSGTTPAEAKKLNRQYIGIDISAEYCELARRRIANAKMPLPGMEA